jgi:orotidine-5'-phosphate decarboxylase
MSLGKKLVELSAAKDLLCLGVDPHPHILSEGGFSDDAVGLDQWITRLQESLLEAKPSIVKPQVALFERMGVSGMQILADFMASSREAGMVVIGDAKRGDIGSTMSAYASAWLSPGRDFEVDALTLSPYLGVGALQPALELAMSHGKGVFVLSATSNPEATTLQSSTRHDGLSVAQGVVVDLAHWVVENALEDAASFGIVVGATVNHQSVGLKLDQVPDMPILAPGFGAQGARVKDSARLFPDSRIVIPTLSRSILEGDPHQMAERYQEANREFSGG